MREREREKRTYKHSIHISRHLTVGGRSLIVSLSHYSIHLTTVLVKLTHSTLAQTKRVRERGREELEVKERVRLSYSHC